jgi:hypothetical protein
VTSSESYWVIIARTGPGFFSHFLQVVGTLGWLQSRTQYTPVVYFNRLFTYWSNAGHNGSRNGWLYYFAPVSPYSLCDLLEIPEDKLQHFHPSDMRNLNRANITFSSEHRPEITGLVGEMREELRRIASGIVNRYIRLNAIVDERLQAIRTTLFADRQVIGVHFRGTDKHPENAQWLKVPFLDVEHYFAKVDKYVDENPATFIFLATDCAKTWELFKSRYGTRFLSTSFRRSYKEPLTYHPSPQQGEEVLIEAYLLSFCNYFVHGISNIAAGTLLLNAALPHESVYRPYLGF